MVENGRLIDGTEADPVERAGLVIDDGRIAAVGTVDSIDRSGDDRTRVDDATGRTITPGATPGVDDGFRLDHSGRDARRRDRRTGAPG